MIFVSTGTEKYPFVRLVKTIDEAKGKSLIKDEVIIQDCAIGNKYRITNCRHFSMLPYEEMNKWIISCDLYVCHAGVGSIITGLRAGKMPVVVPRYVKYREHVDNHQLDITDEFMKRGQIVACYDGDDVVDRLNNYKTYTQNLVQGYTKSSRELLFFIKTII